MLLSDKYPFLTNYFSELLTKENYTLPQSILFYGNDLNSQYVLSKEIARLLNCKEGKTDNCECLNCKWIREETHPAVKVISRLDNKAEGDETKTAISVKQSAMIKSELVSSSEFHRVYIFCDRDDDGNILGLNRTNFQEATANSLLKIIEEPQPGVTFIFLTRYKEDVLSTIISRSQCFFVPNLEDITYNYDVVTGIFENYWKYERKDVFKLSQKLLELSKIVSIKEILDGIQNYILCVLKQNPKQTELINHIKILELAKKEAQLGMRPVNIFDDLCLKLV